MRQAALAFLAAATLTCAPTLPASRPRSFEPRRRSRQNHMLVVGLGLRQFRPDHTYVYSYHVHVWNTHQFVIRGAWAIERDGTVTLTLEGAGVILRRYDVNGDHVVELTGSLYGGVDGYFCRGRGFARLLSPSAPASRDRLSAGRCIGSELR